MQVERAWLASIRDKGLANKYMVIQLTMKC
jgi:hypothetical protein